MQELRTSDVEDLHQKTLNLMCSYCSLSCFAPSLDFPAVSEDSNSHHSFGTVEIKYAYQAARLRLFFKLKAKYSNDVKLPSNCVQLASFEFL